ncbi:hypothetical protein Dimus_017407 [Dionaea muscipula]
MGATANSTNPHENANSAAASAAVAAGMSPRSPRSSVDAHGGNHSRRARTSSRVGESEVSVVVAPSPPPAEAPNLTAQSPGVFSSVGNNKAAAGGGGGGGASSSSQEGFFGEGQVECSGSGNGNGGKKPAWNKPSSNGNFESGPVMGAASWPALSESTKASPKLSSPDPLKIPVDLSVSLSPVPGHPSPSAASPSSPSQKQMIGNANPNPTQNHGRPARQKSMKREAGGSGLVNGGFYHPPALHVSVAEGSPNNSSVKTGSASGVDGAGRERDHVHNNANRENGQRNSSDHPQQRNSYRRGNGGPHLRGDSSHQNYGGRRDHDRGNPDWNHQRNYSGRDPYMQTPRPFARGPMRPPTPVPSSPVMPHPPFHRPFVGPVVPPEYPHLVYYNTQVLSHFITQMPPMFPPQDALPPQDSLLPEKIVKQIDYYFSNENLVKDTYLRKQMDIHGWVPISLIANFKRMKELTSNIQFILDSVVGSSVLEVQGDKIRRRHDWDKWIMPPSVQQSPSASGSVSPRIPGNVMLAAARIQNFGLEERTANFSPMRGPVVADFNYQPQASEAATLSGQI